MLHHHSIYESNPATIDKAIVLYQEVGVAV